MSQFEGLLQGAAGDYKEIKATFEVDKSKTLYHAKPYRIPVAHMLLMKRVINETVKNKALATEMS